MTTSTYQSEASKFLDVPVITWVLFCLMCMLSWKGGRQAKHGNNTENLMERPWSKSPFCASRKLCAHLLGWPHDSCDIVGERQYVQPVNLHVLQQTTKISGCVPLSQSESKRMLIATTSVQASCDASEQDQQNEVQRNSEVALPWRSWNTCVIEGLLLFLIVQVAYDPYFLL